MMRFARRGGPTCGEGGGDVGASDAPLLLSTRNVNLFEFATSHRKQKGRVLFCGRPAFSNLIPAVTYVPTQLPVQYHRPCEA